MQKLVGDCWGYGMLEAMLCSAEGVATGLCMREEPCRLLDVAIGRVTGETWLVYWGEPCCIQGA